MTTESSIERSTLKLARALIQKASVTPNDEGCQQLIIGELETVGFSCESFNYGTVHNLWAKCGDQSPLIVFAGHTDVVPAGPLEQWAHPPFSAAVSDGLLHGRGAADMKGGIAAMITACQRFTTSRSEFKGSIGFLITSDEEGPAIDGTRYALEQLQKRSEIFRWCIVGEPTSHKNLGDTIKNGRRGSLDGSLILHGIQGHVAYPQLADNPIHRAAAVISNLIKFEWDKGNTDFPPTSFQISNIRSGTGARNVIPSEVEILFNFRFSPESTVNDLQKKIETICSQHSDHFSIRWESPSPTYHTPAGTLVDIVKSAIHKQTGLRPILSTSGGTSDGRFIAKTGAEVIELGLMNDTIHSTNEHIRVTDLTLLSKIYEAILVKLLR